MRASRSRSSMFSVHRSYAPRREIGRAEHPPRAARLREPDVEVDELESGGFHERLGRRARRRFDRGVACARSRAWRTTRRAGRGAARSRGRHRRRSARTVPPSGVRSDRCSWVHRSRRDTEPRREPTARSGHSPTSSRCRRDRAHHPTRSARTSTSSPGDRCTKTGSGSSHRRRFPCTPARGRPRPQPRSRPMSRPA